MVEGTAGNTGIGLAHVCNARGYKCVIVMPDNQAAEKYQIIEALGAELRKVPGGALQQPESVSKGRGPLGARIARRHLGQSIRQHRESRRAFRVHRAGNLARHGRQNRRFLRGDRHRRHAGRHGPLFEIASRPRCESFSSIRPAARCYHYIKDGELKSDGGSSITEGIGTGRVTANLEGAPIDDALRIADAETMHFVYRLMREEGLLLGSTAGINVAAAVTLAKQMGPGHTIVTVLCDGGAKYQSRLFNPAWIKERGFQRRDRLGLCAPYLPPSTRRLPRRRPQPPRRSSTWRSSWRRPRATTASATRISRRNWG